MAGIKQVRRWGLIALVGGLTATLLGVVPAVAVTGTDRMISGESLGWQDELVSPNKQYTARITDGNLVVYRAGFGVRWRSGSAPLDKGARLTLRTDGNLVLTSGANQVRWTSGTRDATAVLLRNDGNLVLTKGAVALSADSGAATAWQTNTATQMDVTSTGMQAGATLISPNGRARLVMQGDGNLVASLDDKVTWASGTNRPGSRLVLSTTIGPAILDMNNRIAWAANSAVKDNSTLAITNEGIAKLTTAGSVAWESVHRPTANCNAVDGPVPIADTKVTSNGIRVHACILGNVQRMVNDAAAQGVWLNGGGFRDTGKQIQLRIQNCGGNNYNSIWVKPSSQCNPPTAIPGRSMHERGLAIDFNNTGTRSTTKFQWLSANAAKYGFYNLPSEPWHWSTNGG